MAYSEDQLYTALGDWLRTATPEQVNTPEGQANVQAFGDLHKRRQAAPQQPRFTADMPVEDVRKGIAAIPDEQARVKARNEWADAVMTKEAKEGGVMRGIDSAVRSVARGVPGGTFIDEANAWTGSLLPEALGGRPYDEGLALERARMRQIDRDNPIASTAGTVGGAVASAPLTALRGAGMGANIALDAGIGALQGYGEGEGGVANRAQSAAIDAGISGGMSGLLRGAGRLWNKWSRTAPEIDQAARNLDVNAPFYVRAADPRVQAAGRQYAQEQPASRVAQSWRDVTEGTANAGARSVEAATGAPPSSAVNVAGNAIVPGMQGAVDDATSRIGALARETSDAIPKDFRGALPQTRSAIRDIIAERTAAGSTNPQRGLGDAMALVDMPGGVSWPGVSRFATETGEAIGRPDIVPGDISRSDLARIFKGVRADQPRYVEQAAGPQAAQRFSDNLVQQRDLAGLRDDIANAIRNRQPEALIARAYQAATVKGAGTRLNELGLIANSLSPAEQERLGAGVLAHILNNAGGSQAKISKALSDIAPEARALLFPQGSEVARTVDNLLPMARRLGAMEGMAHTGSARTLGKEIASIAGTTVAPVVAGYTAEAAGLPYGGAVGLAGAGINLGRRGMRALRPMQRGLPQIDPALEKYLEDAASGLARGAVSR